MFKSFEDFLAETPKWGYWLLLIFLVISASALYYSSIAFSSYKHDNLIEEVVEKAIEKATGIDIDLSPDSPEPQP